MTTQQPPLPYLNDAEEKRYGYEHPTERVGYSLKQLLDTVKTANERFEIRKTVVLDLCAHITALEAERDLWQTENKIAQGNIALHLERIAALEHRHDDLVTRCVQAEADRDKLEASNKRLREVVDAANHLSNCLEKTNWSSWQSTASFADAHNSLANKLTALAQEAKPDKVCQTCSQARRFMPDECSTCNGTGRV